MKNVTRDLDAERMGTSTDLGYKPRDRLLDLARRHTVPLFAHLELTKRCNLACVHCYVAGGLSELCADRWVALIDELAAAGCLGVTLTGGEICLCADWQSIATRVHERRMLLTVLTNGTLLTDEDCGFLSGLRPRRVAISLYGAVAEMHDAITGVQGSHARAVDGIRMLKAHGVRCQISSVLMRENLSEFSEIIRLAKELDCEFRFDPTVGPRADGDVSVLEHRVPASDLRTFYSDPDIRARSAIGVLLASEARRSRPRRAIRACAAGFSSVTVDADGLVRACMGLEPVFGSIAVAPFAEVWTGAVASGFREAASAPLIECGNCELSGYCSTRCPRMALAEDGDLLGPSTRACEVAGVLREMLNDRA